MSKFAPTSSNHRSRDVATRRIAKQIGRFLSRRSLRRKAAIATLVPIVSYLVLGRGFSFRDLIIVVAALILGVIALNGERGIRYGFALWVLSLALGYRTIALTSELHIHPSEILLWVLMACICAHRQLVTSSRLTFPLWIWLMIPFWVLAWWPLIVGNAAWDSMLNEFRNFLLLIPLMIVATVVLRQRNNWRLLLLALFLAGTEIAVLGIMEFWFSGVSGLVPAFMTKPSAGNIGGFERAMFSFWGGPMAPFFSPLSLPLGISPIPCCPPP